MSRHLVTVRSSNKDEINEFYISDEALDYLKKVNIIKVPKNTIPEADHTIGSDNLYLKYVKIEISNLEIEKAKIKIILDRDQTKLRTFRTKYFEKVNSMKKYSKLEKFADFINLNQEEVNALISYRKDWITFRDRRTFLLTEIKKSKDKIALIDIELNKYKKFSNNFYQVK